MVRGAAGFIITYAEEHFPETKFYDIGAVVYLAKVCPWQFPDFSVDKYFDRLFELNALIEKNGYYATKSQRFVIAAVK